ncbi:unnamed protein product [Linum trigynum]|uniref:Uncharacterized protein n=1 Tax=Linum trigynum TaxID=586398 RepID=A0AAV2CAK4_9ROSI
MRVTNQWRLRSTIVVQKRRRRSSTSMAAKESVAGGNQMSHKSDHPVSPRRAIGDTVVTEPSKSERQHQTKRKGRKEEPELAKAVIPVTKSHSHTRQSERQWRVWGTAAAVGNQVVDTERHKDVGIFEIGVRV